MMNAFKAPELKTRVAKQRQEQFWKEAQFRYSMTPGDYASDGVPQIDDVRTGLAAEIAFVPGRIKR